MFRVQKEKEKEKEKEKGKDKDVSKPCVCAVFRSLLLVQKT